VLLGSAVTPARSTRRGADLPDWMTAVEAGDLPAPAKGHVRSPAARERFRCLTFACRLPPRGVLASCGEAGARVRHNLGVTSHDRWRAPREARVTSGGPSRAALCSSRCHRPVPHVGEARGPAWFG
jgi:hypothetical protein